MQYFDCCPAALSDDADEVTAIASRHSSPVKIRNATNSTLASNSMYNKRRPMNREFFSRTAPWNVVNCNSPVNPYRVLELRRDATHAEIVGSYRKLALIYHPGRKIACPLERRKRLQFFEVLAACYETLMHNEFRRRCDVLLKDMEKMENSKAKAKPTATATATATATQSISSYKPKTTVFLPQNTRRNLTQHKCRNATEKESIPGLITTSSDSTSTSEEKRYSGVNSGDSNGTLPRNNCTSLGVGMLVCAAGPAALHHPKSSTSVNFAISRDGTKGFRSLVDSSSLSASQASAEEEAEIHFSEATVNRLFGGPLAFLHRARNFQAFSDPYMVFDKVFGNKKPMFPRVTIGDINAATTGELAEDSNAHEWHGSGGNTITIRSLTGLETLSSPSKPKRKNRSKTKNGSSPGDDGGSIGVDDDPTANTKIFVSSRIVNGRKITKTETVHVDPSTGIANVNVTVDGEYLEPITKPKTSQSSSGGGVADW
eukprot:CAMPEP_0172357960 /NCGR_PEP_ID=MMETSP1060-20121228/2306_1 /TAXON_ID=37318 /ORGANISM="Pseudo-nitzschia pungens, Strain cf. cingulata" /LENGTH=485 /DNA_ID=CAMNT_0013078923 /DNA_START=212 /DNA_END=1666 /DNA_ORIENTATION=+